jgi:hypothetical protein
MHVFGKILIWLTIPAAIAAIVFMSQMITLRNEWTKKVEQLEKDNLAEEKKLHELRKEVDEVKMEYDLLALSWNEYWPEIGINAAPGDGEGVEAALGKNDIGFQDGADVPLPVLHAFEPAGDDATRYVGPFLATTIKDASSQYKPTWRPRPGDAERWNTQGSKWRWRAVIPAPYGERFVEIQDRLIRGDQILEDRNKNLEIQTTLLAAAEERLKLNLQQLGVDQEVGQAEVTGLVDAVANAEEERNAAWHELDRLRRALNVETKRRVALAADNRRLMQQLPQPAKGSQPAQKAGVAVKDSKTN